MFENTPWSIYMTSFKILEMSHLPYWLLFSLAKDLVSVTYYTSVVFCLSVCFLFFNPRKKNWSLRQSQCSLWLPGSGDYLGKYCSSNMITVICSIILLFLVFCPNIFLLLESSVWVSPISMAVFKLKWQVEDPWGSDVRSYPKNIKSSWHLRCFCGLSNAHCDICFSH